MIRIDFTGNADLGSCPKWWQNYIHHLYDPVNNLAPADPTDWLPFLEKRLAEQNIIMKNSLAGGFEYLEFETEADYLHFVLIWTLYGK